jgi:SAM-dependent methyltransferase
MPDIRQKRKKIMRKQCVNYGQDAPDLLWSYLRKGAGFVVVGMLTRWMGQRGTSMRTRLCWAEYVLQGSGWFWFARGILMIWSSRIVKVWVANQLLDALDLQGNEMVLDMGCGRGLLLVKAAKRLPSGRAVGIDWWSQIDQGSNNREATLMNAQIEGVLDRVEVHDGDMCDLSFLSDGSVDVVVASKSIHNIPTREGRRQAINEMVRVLKPGGRVALMDIFLIEELAEHLLTCGMRVVCISSPNRLAYPPLQIVMGRKENT